MTRRRRTKKRTQRWSREAQMRAGYVRQGPLFFWGPTPSRLFFCLRQGSWS